MKSFFFKKLLFLFFLPLLFGSGSVKTTKTLKSESGTVLFTSDAPLETIKANSNQLVGIHDFDKNTFAYSVPARSFEGFNSELQKVHFNTRYLQSDEFPNITYKGKLIEGINWNSVEEQVIRTKGIFTVKGIDHSRIILVKVKITDDRFVISSSFDVFLKDHNIEIPLVVESNISERIEVSMSAEYKIPSE